MTEGGRFDEVLASLAAIFRERSVPYALICAFAVAAWGAPRATEDIDVLADVRRSPELDAVLRAGGFEAGGSPAAGPSLNGELASIRAPHSAGACQATP